MTTTEGAWGGKDSFHLTFLGDNPSQRAIRAGTQAGLETRESRKKSAHWLAPPGLLSLLSYNTQDHQLRGDIVHIDFGPSA